jgi:hypothetical protein
MESLRAADEYKEGLLARIVTCKLTPAVSWDNLRRIRFSNFTCCRRVTDKGINVHYAIATPVHVHALKNKKVSHD